MGPILDLAVPAVLGTAAIAFAATALATIVRRRPRHSQDVEEISTRRWVIAALVTATGLAVAAGVVELIGPSRVVDFVDTAAPEVLTWRLGAILAVSILAWFLRGFLVRALGDVPLYVTADEKSDLFATRARILETSTAFVRWALERYPAVYVAGHSLGSVVAYDTLNQLQREARVQPIGDSLATFGRLQGLFTFGSPLDKVNYFFRTRVGPTQKIRAQLLSSLHGFRHDATARDFRPYDLVRYAIPRPQGFWWTNCYASADLVSGRLDRYRADEQCRMPYRGLKAHSRYWEDAAFFDKVFSRL